jgi:hypothetical protein
MAESLRPRESGGAAYHVAISPRADTSLVAQSVTGNGTQPPAQPQAQAQAQAALPNVPMAGESTAIEMGPAAAGTGAIARLHTATSQPPHRRDGQSVDGGRAGGAGGDTARTARPSFSHSASSSLDGPTRELSQQMLSRSHQFLRNFMLSTALINLVFFGVLGYFVIDSRLSMRRFFDVILPLYGHCTHRSPPTSPPGVSSAHARF